LKSATIRLFILTIILIIAFCLVLPGCGNGGNPVSPGGTEMSSGANAPSGSENNRVLWGLWTVEVDTVSGTIDLIPLRGAMLNVNVVQFLQPPSSSMDLLTYTLNPETSFATGYIDLNVTIRHPYFGLHKFRGFDVKGIVMSEGAVPFTFDSTALRAGPDDMQLLNADGWTRWWNPTEFTSYGTIFGYTEGSKAIPGYLATATVNPYKCFADSLGIDAPLSEMELPTRGTFAAGPGINTRRYILQFPVNGGPDFRFNYAVDACWAPPPPDSGPEYPIDAFSVKANMQEAWQVNLNSSGTTAWYVSGESKGGYLKLAVEVFDWQGISQPDGIGGQVTSILVDSPVLASPVDLHTLTSPIDGGPGSSVWEAEIADLNLTASGDFDVWVAVQAHHPTNYAPQLAGGPGAFDWPDVPLRAYIKGTVDVSNSPGTLPEILQVVPAKGEISTVENDVQLIGANFLDGATVEFRYDVSTTLDISDLVWLDSNHLELDVDCTGPLGYYDVTVTNPDMAQGTLEDGFEVVESFECSGYAHDWAGNDYVLNGVGSAEFLRFDTAVIKQGPHQGLALMQTSYSEWALFDPEGGAGQTVTPFMTTPGMLIMDIEICETTGRMGFLSQYNPRIIMFYDPEGNELGEFSDPNLDNFTGAITCMDFDKFGDMWAVTKTGSEVEDWIFEIRHYSLIDEEPFYTPVVEDTIDITNLAMTGPVNGYGVGDIGISFYLHRLFVFTASHSDGGSNKVTSWDLNTSPPTLLNSLQDPYPPFTRHNIFGGTGALSRMEIDVDHRFPEDKYEQCKIYLFASIYTGDIDHWIIRIDGDLNILDEGEIYTVDYPADFDRVPQCAVINDWGPSASANIIGIDWKSHNFVDWPVPASW
jgi:hypothetical protein